MTQDILAAVRDELQQQADEKTRIDSKRYFKEDFICYGVKTVTVTKIAQKYWPEIKHLPKKEIFTLCEELFRADYMEEAFIACEWVYRLRSQYEKADFAVMENWIAKYINNWAKCDTLCNHSVGTLVEMYPQYAENLKQWARSENRWLRRAAAVTLIIPAREGRFLQNIFQIADILLADQDDLVQKGYGWMLKAASQAHQTEVFEYVMRNKKAMPRTALRYAIEKMPEDLKKRAMEKT